MARTHAILRLAALAAVLPTFCSAAPLQEASISKIINEVRVVDPASGAHPASLEEKIHNDLGVKTGVKSRAELLFQDNTLTRLGAESYFSFQPGTREMTLREGTMLLQVPKGLGGAKIHTAAVTASITGTTIMIESWPGRDVKVLVLEGSLRLSVDGRLGEAVTLTPGKMMLMKPGDKHLPDPVDVDLAKVVKTSALIDPATFKGKSKINVAPLPSLGLIQQEISQQSTLKQKAGLVDTNLIIQGKGGKVEIASAETMTALATGKPLKGALVNLTQTATELNDSADASGKAAIIRENLGGKLHGFNDHPGAGPGQSHRGDDSSDEKPAVKPPAKPIDELPTIAVPSPYPLSTASTIDTDKPSVTTAGVAGRGGVYRGEAASGAVPSRYFFGAGAPAALDAGFDADLAQREAALSLSTTGLAAFRFASAELGPQPVITGSRLNLALISLNGLVPASTTGAWNLGALNSLTLAAKAGDITLASDFAAASGTPFQLLDAYARTGNLTVSSNLSFPSATVALWAGGSLTFDAASTVNASNLLLRGIGPVTLDGSLTAGSLAVFSAGDVLINSAPSAPLTVSAAGLITTVDLAGQGGALSLGAHGLQAGAHQVTGFSQIVTSGNVTAASLQAANSILVNGVITRASSSTTLQLDAPRIAAAGGIDVSGASGSTPGAGGQLTLFADSVLIDQGPGESDDHAAGPAGGPGKTSAIASLNAAGGNADPLSTVAGGDGGSIDLGTSARPITGDVTINRTVSASNGASGAAALSTGAGGAVRVVANGTVTVNSTIKVSDATARSGGQVRLESRKTSGAAITLGSSAQILALLNAASVGPGGSVQFVSAGGDISIGKSTIQADRGTVDIRNNGNGLVSLNTANLHGDVVKVGALGPNGQLIIGRGAIDATSAISLYAGGSNGTVLFNKSTTLSGAAMKTIAANTVTISNGQKVTVSGPAANVYTNNANYSGSGGNGKTNGQFIGSGASTHPFSGAPAF